MEGGEGAGKSTITRVIEDQLRSSDISVISTREPGGTPLSESIRETTLADWEPDVPGKAELLLMFAARCAHVQHKILPALEQGEWVICDRFVDASYAYQGVARGLGIQAVSWLDEWVLGEFGPDLTLLLDVDPETGLARAKSRGDTNRFEREDLVFAQQVRNTYLARAEAEPERFRIIDVNQSLDDVTHAVKQVISSEIAEWIKQ